MNYNLDWYDSLVTNPMYAQQGSNMLNPSWGVNTPSPGTNPNAWMPDWMKGAVGDGKNPGWGNLALGGAHFLGNMFLGMKQYGLAKDTFEQNKKQFQLNYDAQKKMTNSQLADRQATRIADSGNSGQHASVADYLREYGIK